MLLYNDLLHRNRKHENVDPLIFGQFMTDFYCLFVRLDNERTNLEHILQGKGHFR